MVSRCVVGRGDLDFCLPNVGDMVKMLQTSVLMTDETMTSSNIVLCCCSRHVFPFSQEKHRLQFYNG